MGAGKVKADQTYLPIPIIRCSYLTIFNRKIFKDGMQKSSNSGSHKQIRWVSTVEESRKNQQQPLENRTVITKRCNEKHPGLSQPKQTRVFLSSSTLSIQAFLQEEQAAVTLDQTLLQC